MTNILKKKQKRKKQNAKNVGGLELVYPFGKKLKCHSLYDEELVSYSEHQNLSPAVLLLVFTQKTWKHGCKEILDTLPINCYQ